MAVFSHSLGHLRPYAASLATGCRAPIPDLRALAQDQEVGHRSCHSSPEAPETQASPFGGGRPRQATPRPTPATDRWTAHGSSLAETIATNAKTIDCWKACSYSTRAMSVNRRQGSGILVCIERHEKSS